MYFLHIYEGFIFLRYFYKFTVELCVHLFSNFLSKVLFFLLDSFTGLETNELRYCYICTVLFCYLINILSYCKVAVLNVYLINPREKTLSVIKQEDHDVPDQDKKHKDTYPYDLFLSDYIRQRVHPDDRTMLEESLELGNVMGVLSGQSEYKGNYRINDRDSIHYYQFRFIKNEDSGIIVLGFLNVDDVVESEIRHQKLLKEALDTAERANAEKSNFLSRMSHDMRTPLNGIIGLLEIDKKHENDVKFLKNNREKAFISASHLLSLINDVLDMSKIEEGGLVLNHEPFDLIRYEKRH